VPRGEFDNLLEAAGARNNGSTNRRPHQLLRGHPLERAGAGALAGGRPHGRLLETMDQRKLDIQRDVVKNERRQSYENRPYGGLWETAAPALYPPGHPYSWTTIGSMEDLDAASLEDVKSFFRRYYVPNNAVLAIAGDVDPAEVRAHGGALLRLDPARRGGRRPESRCRRSRRRVTSRSRTASRCRRST
jgi:zinc protease